MSGLSRAREKLLRRLADGKARRKLELVLVEGARAVDEALGAGVDTQFAVVASASAPWMDTLTRRGVDVSVVGPRDFASLSATESPQGILLVCREPALDVTDLATTLDGRYLILDGVQDPGNAGALVRAAAAFGLAAVLALDGSTDPFGAKAVRASAGSVFRLPVVRAPWAGVDHWLLERGVHLLVADPGGLDAAGITPDLPWALALGSEGAGARADLRSRAAATVAVGGATGFESLNVAMAGGILLYQLRRGEAHV